MSSLTKGFNKENYLTRLKGLKRIEAQTDIVKLIRRWFIFDLVTKRLILPASRLESRKKGKFIIDPASLIDNRLTSEDSDGSHHHTEPEESVIMKNEIGSIADENKTSPHKSGEKSILPLKQDDLSVSRDDLNHS